MRGAFGWIDVAVVLAILLLLASLCLPGAMAFVEAPLRLLFGFVPFLRRAVPRITVSPTGVATFAALLVALAVTVHRLGRRAVPGDRNQERRGWSWRATAAACGLFVALFAAGVAVTGFGHQVGWLLRSPVPLTERFNPARRAHSRDNVRQIALAFHNYHATHDRLPPGGTFAPSGRGRHGWATHLLPFLDEERLYNAVEWAEPWDAAANRAAFVTPVPPLRTPHPGLPTRDAARYALAHYAANARVLTDGGGLRFEDIPDGAAHTLLAGEVVGNLLPWGHPANARDPAVGVGHPAGFGGPWRGA